MSSNNSPKYVSQSTGNTIIQNYRKIIQNYRTLLSSLNSLHIEFSLRVYNRIFCHDRPTQVKPKYPNKLSERASRNHSNRKIKTEWVKLGFYLAKHHYLTVTRNKTISLGGQNPKSSTEWREVAKT